MARYKAQLASPAALANDTGFAWLMGAATEGCKLRRVIIGCRHTTAATAVTDFQTKVGVNRVTGDGTTITAGTITKDDLRHPTPATRFASAWATPPALASSDSLVIPFNAKSGVDLPFEFLEEFWVDNLVTDGFAFVNRGGALPASHVFDITVAFEV